MNSFRRISLPIHGLVELTAGIALVVCAFGLGFGAAGTVLTFGAGVILTGLGLGATDALSLATHRSLDRMLTIGLSAGAIGAALGDEIGAAVLLLLGAGGLMLLSAMTCWTRAPAGT